eukprot:CAMPEP_0171209664 /NCGR_PEP_ID=MMETSP0790-20130122/28710_1 /TAXON_ID=2925 /ORGANISM="Alexandrium catenella, Strain OF101" /LENGTH=300 /DNA_ID=CAMNT_0011675277 /DNA_START=4 /DNA_END=906 /DNA_ORIENTATION=-
MGRSAADESANRTAEPCYEDKVAWDPLDMPGTVSRRAEDATECQQRCANTKGCTHFSYWWIGNNCHLQDAYAIRQTGRLGFISGPFGCWENLDQNKYIKKGLSIVQSGYNCVELGTMYEPLMGLVKMIQKEDLTGIEAVKECRKYCADNQDCHYYSIVFPDRMCRMAGKHAKKVTPYINAVSGTPTCWDGEEHDHKITAEEAAALRTAKQSGFSDEQSEMIMKASLRRGAPAARRPELLTGGVALLLVGGAVAWGIVLAGRRAGRRSSSLARGSSARTASAYATVDRLTESLAASSEGVE